VNIAKVNAMNSPMFQNDILCIRCAYWYSPQVLSDEEHVCPSCKRKAEKSTNRQVLLNETKRQIDGLFRLADVEDHETFVYFVQGIKTRLLKVGYTNNPSERLKNHQVGSPDILICVGYIYGSFQIENQFHKALSPFVSHGEWFDLPDGLMNYISRRIYIGLPLSK
jgi:hypothetical protein